MKNIESYLYNLKQNSEFLRIKKVNILAQTLFKTLKIKKRIFLCGNGGSAANAIHIANDFNNETVLFDYSTVHYAPINKSKNFRVSAEFTIICW
jgi:phosphoheptose isomerase